MWMYLSEHERFKDFGNEGALVWHESGIPYAVWGQESSRTLSLKYYPSEVLLNLLYVLSFQSLFHIGVRGFWCVNSSYRLWRKMDLCMHMSSLHGQDTLQTPMTRSFSLLQHLDGHIVRSYFLLVILSFGLVFFTCNRAQIIYQYLRICGLIHFSYRDVYAQVKSR